MNKFVLSAVAAALMLGAVPAMAQNAAIVNGKAVPKARMDQLAQQLAAAGRPVTPDMQDQLREEVVVREVFMQEAQRKGLDTSEEYKSQMELARQAVLIRQLFEDFRKNNPVTEEELKKAYAPLAEANSGSEYKVRHILVESEDAAKKVIADLKKGAKFEELAKKLSKDPGSGANGGDLDWTAPANLVPEFSEAMVKLQKGETTSAPVKTSFGWHVIRMDDMRKMDFPPLEQIKPELERQLQQQKLQAYQQELRSKARVE